MEITLNTTPAYVCQGHVDFVKNFASKKMAEKRATKFVAKYLKNETIATATPMILERKDINNVFKKAMAFFFDKYALEINFFHKVGTCPDAPKAEQAKIINGVKA